MKSVGVFCGSSEGSKPEYKNAAQCFGEILAKNNITVVYGAGNIGMMGHLADAVLENNGKIIGVIPEHLMGREICHEELTELHVVKTMSERKNLIVELSDAFVAMPGGLGTFDELLEVMTYQQLEISNKPCGILNTEGYFNYLIQLFNHAVSEKFLKSEHRENLVIAEDPESLFQKLSHYQPVQVSKFWVKDLKEKNSF